MTENKTRSNAIKVGAFCVAVYVTNYIARNVLSILTPFILADGLYTKEYLGTLTSVYLALYGAGQLVNGLLGEKIRPAVMILASCVLSGTGLLAFPLFRAAAVHVAGFALLGFGLSMMRGPLMKLITGNAPPKTARSVCVVFSTLSFVGPIIVSLFAMVMKWDLVFYTTAAVLYAAGALSFVCLTVGMRRGRVLFEPSRESIFGSFRELLRARHVYFYLIVAIVVEIVSIVISFWAPTYLSEYLAFSPEEAATIYSVISFVSVPCYAISVVLYNRVFKNDVVMVVVFYGATALCFASLYFTKTMPALNVTAFALALIFNKFVSSLLWSVYVPGLAAYHCVSCGNGVYDFTGYIASSAVGLVFSHAVGALGWGALIVIWAGIAVFGAVCAAVCLALDRRRKGKTA